MLGTVQQKPAINIGSINTNVQLYKDFFMLLAFGAGLWGSNGKT
jgi:hypothetical protein